MQALFSVPVHDIDVGGLVKSFELPLDWLARVLAGTDVEATEIGHASIRLSRTGRDIVVRGTVKTALEVPCARCLAPVAYPVNGELALLLQPARSDHAAAKHAATKAKDAASKVKDTPAKEPAAPTASAPAASSAAPKRAPFKDAAKTNGTSKRGKAHDEDEYEFSSEEADVDFFDGETVVLDEFLREAVLLEVPSFPLCSEDCPGIRPSAKAAPEPREPTLDPRLSPLRALKTKLMLAASSGAPPGGDDHPPGEGDDPAPERPVLAAKSARPKIQAHRSVGAAGASKKAKAKLSPKKAK